MYNPFKAHIAQLHTGKYVVRRSALICWTYLDNNRIATQSKPFWWSMEQHVYKYCTFNTAEEAQARLDKYRTKQPKFSSKKV